MRHAAPAAGHGIPGALLRLLRFEERALCCACCEAHEVIEPAGCAMRASQAVGAVLTAQLWCFNACRMPCLAGCPTELASACPPSLPPQLRYCYRSDQARHAAESLALVECLAEAGYRPTVYPQASALWHAHMLAICCP